MDREEKIEVDKLVAETNWKHIQILELKDKIKEQEERIQSLRSNYVSYRNRLDRNSICGYCERN